MKFKLNGWQRIWIVVAVVMLVLTVAFIASSWPQPESGVVSDLASPACKSWRELPHGFFPDASPEWNDPCHSLKYFLYWNRINLSGPADYDSFIFRNREKLVGEAISLWLGTILCIYVFGWVIAWIRRGFSKNI